MESGSNNPSEQYKTNGKWYQSSQLGVGSHLTPLVTATATWSSRGKDNRGISGLRQTPPIQPIQLFSGQNAIASGNKPPVVARASVIQSVRNCTSNEVPAALNLSTGLAPAPGVTAMSSEAERNGDLVPDADANITDPDEDVVLLCDKGKNRLFPNEPELSSEFRDYLYSVATFQNAENIMALAHDIPRMLKTSPGRHVNKSYCFITSRDLQCADEEVDRIVGKWSVEEQRKLAENPDSTMQLLSFHKYLICRILIAKKTCLKKKLDAMLNVERDNDKKLLMSSLKEVHYSLYWQAGVFKDMYRQTLMTPFMLDKRMNELGLKMTTGQKRGSTASQRVPAKSKRRSAKTSRKTPVAKNVKVTDLSRQASK